MRIQTIVPVVVVTTAAAMMLMSTTGMKLNMRYAARVLVSGIYTYSDCVATCLLLLLILSFLLRLGSLIGHGGRIGLCNVRAHQLK